MKQNQNQKRNQKPKTKTNKKKCECCGVSDKSVGLATGENGVEMWVCRFCDVDGSNYNGWGDVEEDLDKEIRCPTCCSFIVVGQLIEEDERYCENCWEPKEDDELLALSDILKKYVDSDTHDKIIQDMKQDMKQ